MADPLYLTPTDATTLFSQQALIKATNLQDPAATSINAPRLQMACENATGLINGYLMECLDLSLSASWPSWFLTTLRQRAADVLFHCLGVDTDAANLRYEEGVSWLESFVKAQKATGSRTPGTDNTLSKAAIAFSVSDQFWSNDNYENIWSVPGDRP